MNIYTTPSFSIVFGTSTQSYTPQLNKGFVALSKAPFKSLARIMPLDQLVFLNQIHSVDGKIITKEDAKYMLPSFVNDGDFIITNVPRVGLGTSTADCLPLIFYDKRNHVVAIAHAGWRGSVAGIGKKVLDKMKQEFNTIPHEVEVVFGPSAKACCYKVQEDFITNVQAFSYAETLFRKTDDGLFFGLERLNRLQLEQAGVTTFHQQYHACTICDPAYCSVRRMPGSLERQMTVVALR